MEVTFTALLISSIVGFILSFLVENIPAFAPAWSEFKYKGLAVAGSGLAVCIALVILSYAGAPVVGVPRPFIWEGLWTTAGVYLAYLMASQTAYQLQAGNLRRKQAPQHDEASVGVAEPGILTMNSLGYGDFAVQDPNASISFGGMGTTVTAALIGDAGEHLP